MEFLSKQELKQVGEGLLHMKLNEPEFLVTLVFEYFGEKCDLVIISEVDLNWMDYGWGPLNDQVFEAVLLV
jgi:hypothetical protein